MSKHNFVKNGVTRLPPGFRFQPTDEELLFHYLRCKIFVIPLPEYIIPEVHCSQLDPRELPGESMEDRYFFTKKGAKYISGNNKYRTANNGCWEVSGSEEHISPPPNQNLDMMMGIKKTLVFKIRKFPNNCRRTDWLMREYSLALINNNVKNYKDTSDWVICHVFNKIKMEEEEAIMVEYSNDNRGYYDLGATSSKFNEIVFFENSCPCSSSSSSSNSVAEDSSNDLQSEEETSYFL